MNHATQAQIQPNWYSPTRDSTGNNCETCFYAEQDYRQYLNDLREDAKKYRCRIHDYVLMTNHVHILVTPILEYGISQMMRALGRRYVYFINKTYKRTGTLWEGRYKASLIDTDAYLLTCMRYIELNPIRANMVSHPGEYRWSSYQANAQSDVNPLIDHHPLYMALGTTNEIRKSVYRELFRHHIDNDALHEIRASLNHELVLERYYFKDRIEELIKRQIRLGQPGRPKIEEEEEIYYVEY